MLILNIDYANNSGFSRPDAALYPVLYKSDDAALYSPFWRLMYAVSVTEVIHISKHGFLVCQDSKPFGYIAEHWPSELDFSMIWHRKDTWYWFWIARPTDVFIATPYCTRVLLHASVQQFLVRSLSTRRHSARIERKKENKKTINGWYMKNSDEDKV